MALTAEETEELKRLREYQQDKSRWLSQYDYDRIYELTKKKYE